MAEPAGTDRPLLVGATAADPRNAVTIWNAIRRWFVDHGQPMEFALYSTYEPLCGALLAGEVDIAWNAPMAHAQALLASDGACRTLAMRDTDRDVATVIVALADAGIAGIEDLRGRRLALGVPTSTELHLIPAHQLRQEGFDVGSDAVPVDLEPRTYPNGQRWVDDGLILDAVVDGRADAGAIFEPWLAPMLRRRGLGSDDVAIVWRTEPFCHCAFTARPGLPSDVAGRFVATLVAMDPDDPGVAEMMRLEHLTRWVPADASGWRDAIEALRANRLVGATFS